MAEKNPSAAEDSATTAQMTGDAVAPDTLARRIARPIPRETSRPRGDGREKRTRRPALLLALSVGFAVAGQFYFAGMPGYMWDGVALYLASAVCLLMLARSLEGAPGAPARPRRSVWSAAVRFAVQNPMQAGFYVVSVLAAVRVVQQMRALPDNSDHYPVALVWLAGLAALGAALSLHVAPLAESREVAPDGTESSISYEIGTVVIVLVAAFLLRGLFVDVLPANFGGDEGSQGLSARAFLEGRSKNLFGTGWFSMPNLFFLLQAATLKLFGDDVYGLRMLSVVKGTAAVRYSYLMVRELLGVRLAMVATTLFATYHFHIHYSRLGSAQVGDSLLYLAVFYLLLRGLRSGRGIWFWAAGIFLGLTQYFYFGARLVPILVAVCMAYLALVDRKTMKRHAGGLVGMVATALLVALPYLVYVTRHPEVYMSRVNQVGIFQSGWYARELAMGRDPVSVLTEQAMRSLLAFNYYPDKVYWYHPGIPLLDFFSSIFFVFGLAYATWRLVDRRYFVIASSYWLALLFGAFLTENPPSSMRLVILSPLASILVAIGMMKMREWASDALGGPRRLHDAILGGVLLLAMLISVGFYFDDYSRHRTEGYGGPNTEVATEMAWYLRGIGTDHRVYFFGAPRMFLDFATIPFIARGVQGMDVKEPLTGPPSFVGQEPRSVFIFLPERQQELQVLKRYLPAGVQEEVRGRELGRLLFVAYRVDRTPGSSPPS